MSQIDDIGAVILALAGSKEAKEAFKRTLGWRDRWEMDHVTIPRAQHEALMMALEAAWLLEAAELFHANCEECGGDAEMELCGECFPLADGARLKRREALMKARAAGIHLEEKT